jgi:ribosomal protein S18 acetylase RimI-like enzyme
VSGDPSTVVYAIEPDLKPAEFVDVLRRSGLDRRRPVDQPDVVAKMLKHAGIILCARDGQGRLIGVSRALADFSYCCYLSDLAVDRAWQGLGIGTELMRRTRAAAGGEAVTLLLLSAPDAMAYYPKAGMEKLENCFGWKRGQG